MDRQNEVKAIVTREQAAAIIKRAKTGARFNVHVRMDLAIEGDPDHIYTDGGASYLPVSKAEMLRLIGNLMSDTMEAKGGRLRLTYYDRESWTRSKPGKPTQKILTTSYWLG